MRPMRLIAALGLTMGLSALVPAGTGAAEPAAAAGPRITVDEVDYQFGQVPQDRAVEHVFKVLNTGTKPLVITRVSTSCGCTAAMMESSVIDPGQTGRLRVSFNPHGQKQSVTRTVTIHSNDPERPTLPIKISAQVAVPGESTKAPAPVKRAHPPEAKLELKAACLKCHGPGSPSQKGAKLFASACSACHGASGQGIAIDREIIGPPLRLVSTTVKTPAGITQVIAAGTGHPRMPGYAKAYGGPLTDAQVASLVDLIIKGFPAR